MPWKLWKKSKIPIFIPFRPLLEPIRHQNQILRQKLQKKQVSVQISINENFCQIQKATFVSGEIFFPGLSYVAKVDFSQWLFWIPGKCSVITISIETCFYCNFCGRIWIWGHIGSTSGPSALNKAFLVEKVPWKWWKNRKYPFFTCLDQT